MLPFTLAASCASAPAHDVASPLFKKEKVSQGDEPHLPQNFSAPGCGGSVNGSYKLCISPNGNISSVDVVQAIPDADADIMAALWRWRYKPQVIPICFVQNLQFQIDCHKAHAQQVDAEQDEDAQRALRMTELESPKSEAVPAAYLDAQKVSTDDDPPAPEIVKSLRCGSGVHGTYRICVAQEGTVSSVQVLQAISGNDELITEAIGRFRYRPQPAPICVVKQIDYPAPCP